MTPGKVEEIIAGQRDKHPVCSEYFFYKKANEGRIDGKVVLKWLREGKSESRDAFRKKAGDLLKPPAAAVKPGGLAGVPPGPGVPRNDFEDNGAGKSPLAAGVKPKKR
jgi:hypothetical protein